MKIFQLATIVSFAFLCLSGQMPRKEVESAPAPVSLNEQAQTKQEPVVQPKRKSAAQKSMEAVINGAEIRKSAAKRSMEAT